MAEKGNKKNKKSTKIIIILIKEIFKKEHKTKNHPWNLLDSTLFNDLRRIISRQK